MNYHEACIDIVHCVESEGICGIYGWWTLISGV
jgi:hypothetical protein